MSKVIVISGAGSGFGAFSARALADAGNTVYAGIRETPPQRGRVVRPRDRRCAGVTCAPWSLTCLAGSVDAGIAGS